MMISFIIDRNHNFTPFFIVLLFNKVIILHKFRFLFIFFYDLFIVLMRHIVIVVLIQYLFIIIMI